MTNGFVAGEGHAQAMLDDLAVGQIAMVSPLIRTRMMGSMVRETAGGGEADEEARDDGKDDDSPVGLKIAAGARNRPCFLAFSLPVCTHAFCHLPVDNKSYRTRNERLYNTGLAAANGWPVKDNKRRARLRAGRSRNRSMSKSRSKSRRGVGCDGVCPALSLNLALNPVPTPPLNLNPNPAFRISE